MLRRAPRKHGLLCKPVLKRPLKSPFGVFFFHGLTVDSAVLQLGRGSGRAASMCNTQLAAASPTHNTL